MRARVCLSFILQMPSMTEKVFVLFCLVFILFLTLFCYVSSLKPFAMINDGLGLKHFRSVKSRLNLRWILRWWKRKRQQERGG